MKNEPSRREFVKAAVAASIGVATPVEAAGKNAKAETDKVAAQSDVEKAYNEIGFPRIHTGRQLARISRPLGGIGTGGIGLSGRGNLQDWQIFNRPDIGNSPEYAFPSMWVGTIGKAPYGVVLERRFLPPYDLYSEGLGFANAPGLPRLAEARFSGAFPISQIDFQDRECPVQVKLDAFSPFYPLDTDASGLPCAVLTYEVHNPGTSSVEVAVAWSISNPVGNSEHRSNEERAASGITGLVMTDPSLAADHVLKGSFVLAALSDNGGATEVLPSWRGGSIWRVGPQHFWFDEFAKTGHLGKPGEVSTPVGSVSIRQTIPAGGTRNFRFLLAWHFPNRTPERCGWDAPEGKKNAVIGNYYCTQFEDAWTVAEHVAHNIATLEEKTRAFADALKNSTLPGAVKDGAASNLSTLVSNTSFRIADGSFQGFEGCGDRGGMGFGTCLHVWNYEVATQFVFPALGRSMRDTSFGYALDDEGHMDFRHKLPPSKERWGAAAADGQMGQIVKLYLDWMQSGDDACLRGLWPAAKRALAYAWRPGSWDERKSGVMDGVQHNTYDIELYGPNPMCGTWYLAALRAMALMADAMDDAETAAECRRMGEQGGKWMDAHLFNGEYYVQQIHGIAKDKIASGLLVGMGSKDTEHPMFQVGDGCLVDQLVGQYMATVAGMGDLLDSDHIRKTLESIYRYNYKRDLTHHASVQRVYALNDEAALVICDFTRGTRPDVPLPYYAEVMTGFEYSAAVLMLAHGMVNEGLECIANIRRRYDGEKANPYDETEYGRHYARAMASWAAIPVLSGFVYDARKSRLKLAPKLKVSEFRSFISTPTGWGSFELSALRFKLTLAVGTLRLKELFVTPAFRGGNLRITNGGSEVSHTSSVQNGGILLHFSSEVSISPGASLEIHS